MTLSDLSVKIAYGYTASASEVQISNEPKFLRITDIQGGIVNWESVPYCEITENKINNYKLNYGDIVVARTGNSTGENYMYDSTETAVFASYLIRYIINKDIAYPKFIWYQMRSNKWFGFINNAKSGSAQAGANAQTMGMFECVIPPLETQQKIANILSTLDDKIELNRKMNQTLEEMAQAIFKSWFVDFDPVHALANRGDKELEKVASELGISKEVLELLPSEFEESELGMIPMRWEVTRFGNTVEKYIDNRGKTPPTVESGIPLLEVRNMPDDMLTSNPNVVKFVTEDIYNTWFRSYLEENDILISTVGTIGKTSIMPKDSKIAIAQNVLGIRFKSDILKSQFMFYQMKHKKFLHAIDARLVITVQASIKRKDLDTIDVIIPPKEIQELFAKQIQPIIEKQQSNENINLQKTRDALLPKLLSGELDVSEVEVE